MFQGKTERFTWYSAHDNDHGLEGWIMSSMPHFDPVAGRGLAHDMLEHFTPRAGNEGEAEAFGAIAWIRIEGGYWTAYNPNTGHLTLKDHANSLGSEFANFLAQSDWQCRAPDAWEVVPEVDDECGMRTLLRNIAARTAYYARKEFGMPSGERECIRNMYQWLCIGYQKVQEFYGTNAQAMAALFWELENAIDQNAKWVEHCSGDQIEVRINPDFTWALNTITGQDENGDYWEDGQPVSSDDEDDEDE